MLKYLMSSVQTILKFLTSSIRTKILLPYFMLILIVGVAGAYIVTYLVSDSIEEGLDNRLIGASQVVADGVVDQEEERLSVLRHTSLTEGVGLNLQNADYEKLQELVNPIIINNPHIDAIVILNDEGVETVGFWRSLTSDALLEPVVQGVSYLHWQQVRQVLAGEVDDFGDKFTILAIDRDNLEKSILYTVGHVLDDDKVVGVVLIGMYIKKAMKDLQIKSLANLTLYDLQGNVIETTFDKNSQDAQKLLAQKIDVRKVWNDRERQTHKKEINITGIEYTLTFSLFELRGQSVGIYSVGVPSAYIDETTIFSRNLLIGIVSVVISFLVAVSIFITNQISRPILRLVHTTASIAAGDLTQRTGIESIDEIGHLAKSFDIMTAKLEQRTSELEDLLRLMENEASKIRAILTSIADGVLVHDLTGVIIEKNPAAERILADATDEAELKQITELDTSTHGTETHDQLKRLTIGKRTIDTIASLVITTNNKILGSVVVLRDITKEVENERLKDEFIGNISHELRTPIIVIKGYIQILQMFSMGQWPENQVDLLQKIAMSTDDLHNLITTVIDMTEIEAGELGIDKYDFTLDDLLCDVEGKWESIMEEREITFTLHIVDENMMVEGDEVQLQKIFDYLLDNASKYNRPGGRVDVYAFKEGDFAQIDIKDSGVGIVEREEQSIFERFVRALHEDFYETRGLGLGLYLARAITNVHGGKIWYESEIDKGSTFSFTIPCFISPDSDLPGF